MNTTVFSIAWSAIYAGHVAGGVGVPEETRDEEKRNEHTDIQKWYSFWGRDSKETWRDEALGSGTPLVCLYLLGYCWGKHSFGLLSGALLFILPCWGAFTLLALADGSKNFWDMWANMMTSLALSVMVLFARIAKRTPKGIPLFSTDIWMAMCLETFLANTLTCVSHVLAALRDEWREALGEETWIGRFTIVLTPFGLWHMLNNQALAIQAATLRKQNMATRHGGGRGCIPLHQGGEYFPDIVCECLASIIENSRDLGVTGLSRGQLEWLATEIGDRKEAGYIRFFTRGRKELPNAFDILYAFYQGYAFEKDLAEAYQRDTGSVGDYKKVCEWVDEWLRTQNCGDPLEAITKLSQSTEPQECSDALATICPIKGQYGRNRWLCGFVAKVCDDNVAFAVDGLPHPDGSDAEEAKSINVQISHQFFALVAAALTVNRNPLTVFQMGDVKNEAAEMLKIMEIGCEQVLRQTTKNDFVYIGRGVVLSDPPKAAAGSRACLGDSYRVTYSIGEVWQAEQRRETVMIGRDSFNRFWHALIRDKRILKPQERQQLLDKSVEWSKKVAIDVDYGHVLASLGSEGNTLVSVRDSAILGWCTHTLWVVLTIVLHFYFPHHLFTMALVSIAALVLIKADQYTMVVYVGCRLWRSYAGRICLLLPPMIDDDIDGMMLYLFWIVIFVVNLGGAYLGTIAHTPIETALFVSLLLGSIVPGLWYCVLCEDKGAEGGRAVVSYVGRKRGEGYRHRDTPEHFRPLGKDVLKLKDVEIPTTNESADHDGAVLNRAYVEVPTTNESADHDDAVLPPGAAGASSSPRKSGDLLSPRLCRSWFSPL